MAKSVVVAVTDRVLRSDNHIQMALISPDLPLPACRYRQRLLDHDGDNKVCATCDALRSKPISRLGSPRESASAGNCRCSWRPFDPKVAGPMDDAPPSVCSIDGCPLAFYGRTWCRPHYMRWYKYGDPLHVYVPPSRECKVDGYHFKHMARGRCQRHYDNLRYRGSVEAEPSANRRIDPAEDFGRRSISPEIAGFGLVEPVGTVKR